jgi:hypothetical protein
MVRVHLATSRSELSPRINARPETPRHHARFTFGKTWRVRSGAHRDKGIVDGQRHNLVLHWGEDRCTRAVWDCSRVRWRWLGGGVSGESVTVRSRDAKLVGRGYSVMSHKEVRHEI